jgi:hypothetical protein
MVRMTMITQTERNDSLQIARTKPAIDWIHTGSSHLDHRLAGKTARNGTIGNEQNARVAKAIVLNGSHG